MPTPTRNAQSIQIATRVKLDVYGLMSRDAGEFRGVASVNNAILEKHYSKELSAIRTHKAPAHAHPHKRKSAR